MQFKTLKGVKQSNSQFCLVLVSIDINTKGEYEAILTTKDRKKFGSGHTTSDIHIVGKNKATIYKQIKELARVFPPVDDVCILDLEEAKKIHGE